eukprot:gnl/Trimastix_PCT/2922.p1 GENE.gnl/Trimastix_PCT/2922~~gnl/Trimastix_PCT/2922.p1  ORF type:complete len:607 (+),score=181.04 gnl/Trimastix_PCT/2922:34-1854(+)
MKCKPAFLFALLLIVISAHALDGTVYKKKDGTIEFKQGKMNDQGLAFGRFEDTLHQEGWGKLYIMTNPNHSDEDQMYGAGFLEAALTHERIYQHFTVTRGHTLKGMQATEWPANITKYMQKNIEFTHWVARQGGDYSNQLALQLTQFKGLVDGYVRCAPAEHRVANAEFEFWLFNSNSDLEDLQPALLHPHRNAALGEDWAETHSHCTGLVRLLPKYKEVFFAQDTWSGYHTMNRILKSYSFRHKSTSTASQQVMFSSYPGILYSVDDFYVLSNKMNVLETTFHCWNHTMYDMYVKPETILTWLRVQVANRMATKGKHWQEIFAQHNSGTYNNQYVILDHSLFDIDVQPEKGFLWVVEQLPGHIVGGDHTKQLIKTGYYPSINAPSYPHMYTLAGYPEMVRKHGDYWSYQNTSRMRIIRRDVPKIGNYAEFKQFMRYNDWHHDPLSNGDPAQTIESRYDLRPSGLAGGRKAHPFGGTDSKTTSHRQTIRMQMDAISSPTTQGGLPPWRFGVAPFEDEPHLGLPLVWDFKWIAFHATDFGMGHQPSVPAILGIIACVIAIALLVLWMIYSQRKKRTMPEFNPEPVDITQDDTAPLLAPQQPASGSAA